MNGVGYVNVTEEGVAGTSGTPKIVYGYNVTNTASGDSTTSLRDGTTASATAVVSHTTTAGASATEVVSFNGVGVMFPNGCFVDFDNNTSSVIVWYKEVV